MCLCEYECMRVYLCVRARSCASAARVRLRAYTRVRVWLGARACATTWYVRRCNGGLVLSSTFTNRLRSYAEVHRGLTVKKLASHIIWRGFLLSCLATCHTLTKHVMKPQSHA